MNNSSQIKKLLLTGGHAATTALAIVEEIKKRNLNWDLYWVGSEVAVEGSKIKTLESQIFPKMGIKTYSIVSGRVQNRFTFWTIPSLFKIPVGFLHAFEILSKVKPDLILSFGGFAAVPVVIVGWMFRIPVVVQEQVATAGRANQISSFFARKIILSREKSKKYYPFRKSIILGNPVLPAVLEVKPIREPHSPKTIYITGGSRGSKNINSLVESIIPNLLKQFKIIHQTGQLDYEKFVSLKNKLEINLKNKYEVYSQVEPLEVANFYKDSDIIISRAGANTVSEIMIVKRPSILIPIPWSYKNEQYENAAFAEEFGIATVLDQELTTSEILESTIGNINKNWEKIIKQALLTHSLDETASSKIVDLLEGYLK